KDAAFSATYHLTVLEIERPGFEERLDTDSTALRTGDILLVQGKWADIFALKSRERRNFIVMGETEALAVAVNREKAPVALAIMVGMLFLMITGWVSVTGASMLAGLAIILTGCLSMDDAYNAIDWKSIVLIAGMLPMSTALEKVGLVELVASGFTDVLGSMGPMAILAALFLMTSVSTQVLSNTATAVIIVPIAFVTATSMGVQPHAFMMAVAVAASMAFASPVASPVNALVMGAGNYRFSDYAKVGIPMILIALIITVIVLPILWPF
ncbi:MAG: anion permease, partial [Anaerolineae bacterium]|nr:anion permease [Anaerolineae bacterium]